MVGADLVVVSSKLIDHIEALSMTRFQQCCIKYKKFIRLNVYEFQSVKLKYYRGTFNTFTHKPPLVGYKKKNKKNNILCLGVEIAEKKKRIFVGVSEVIKLVIHSITFCE
ncbi:Hypothetical predicted protein [Octopus vulgaris]|uniref:Uncharacterized protein n=1 Tax=Octopus vulgaris TaxID=6645 RepID=A0AA36F696_OCTVU|nr:Hypothetical predicted protein [Octopus vulgaris]